MTLLIRPAGVPFLATADITTVTSSPALNVLAVKPQLTRVEGALFSQIQCTTLPFSSVTSTIRNECGFVHSHCVTFPLMVTILFSYDAFPWCASNGVAPARKTKSSKLAGNRLVIDHPPPSQFERPENDQGSTPGQRQPHEYKRRRKKGSTALSRGRGSSIRFRNRAAGSPWQNAAA